MNIYKNKSADKKFSILEYLLNQNFKVCVVVAAARFVQGSIRQSSFCPRLVSLSSSRPCCCCSSSSFVQLVPSLLLQQPAAAAAAAATTAAASAAAAAGTRQQAAGSGRLKQVSKGSSTKRAGRNERGRNDWTERDLDESSKTHS